ncbi:MAG TPA: isoprenylcysteine carboxyl methyltransferase [Micromonosporaceae bacterium]|nr:isoprenylcysteine carboxyl methyltransferase [Micromonosporaceae bacterium]HCU50456.1 isoprenylcysteine carboxyl methyltransferase [Micromonosporaceae bacterium]
MQQRKRAAIGSLVFFALAPGTVAGLVPYWLSDGWQSTAAHWYLRVPGALLIGAGLVVLIQAFVRFVVDGLGTPAPVAPTKHLVVTGFYRYVRNPMYVAIVAIIVGQALWFAHWGLLAYAAIAWAGPALFVRFYEEPTLARTFGAEYDEYRRNVPAWLPRLRPWNSLH